MAYTNRKNQLSTVINHTTPNSWELQDAEMIRLVKAYMQNFKYSSLYLKACSEKYDWHMWSYVHHVAEIQAQMITGAKVGYDGSVLFGKTGDKDMANKFLDEQRGYCAYGDIDVHIPTDMINRWKSLAVTEVVQRGSLAAM